MGRILTVLYRGPTLFSFLENVMKYLFLLSVCALLSGCTITTSLFVENQSNGHRERASISTTYVTPPRHQPVYLP